MPFRFLAVALLALTQLGGEPAPAPMSDPEAYAVYTAHFAGARPEGLIPPAPLLIQATTETWDGGPHCFPDTIKPEWQEVLADYRR
jgi:hypothetical protein